jgi:hypothetical protein
MRDVRKGSGMQHERVLVISPRKSGTHLIQRLLSELGYGVWGDLGASASAMPRLSIRQRLGLASLVMGDRELRTLDARTRTEEFVRKTNIAWAELAQSWSCRLGASRMEPYRALQALARRELATRPELWTISFSQTPPNICWIYHSLDIAAMDPSFLFEWQKSKRPAVILNRRDPRDALISVANFLGESGGREFRKVPEAQIYRPGYSQLERIEDRIDKVLSDPCLPFFQDYERAVSFYRHPDVCNVSFEELTGPKGGGSLTEQQAAVARVARFLGVASYDPVAVTDGLFDPNAFTFHKGQIGAWRSTLSEPQQAVVKAKHGDLIAALGYA